MSVLDRKIPQMPVVDKIDENAPNEYRKVKYIVKRGKTLLSTSCAQSTVSTTRTFFDASVDKIDKLPDRCPLKTGKNPPPECRFDPPLFFRMIGTGILPDDDTGCPIKMVCGLGNSTKNYNNLNENMDEY